MLTTRYFGPRTLPLENERVGSFVSKLIWGNPDQIAYYCSMGVFDGGELVAGTLYHNWQQESGVIELTSASTTRRWLTRPVVRAMFHLPFDLLDCSTSVLRVSERNTSMIRIAKAFGFQGYHIPHLRGRDGGEWVFVYTDDQWRSSPYRGEAA